MIRCVEIAVDQCRRDNVLFSLFWDHVRCAVLQTAGLCSTYKNCAKLHTAEGLAVTWLGKDAEQAYGMQDFVTDAGNEMQHYSYPFQTVFFLNIAAVTQKC